MTGIATFVAGLVAVLVWFEARSIRRMEWLSRSVQLWQGFNDTLLADDRADRWKAFLDGTLTGEEITRRDEHVLFSYVNIIYSEYSFAAAGLIDQSYAETSISRNLHQLVPQRDHICPLLRYTGYDDAFVDLLERYPDMTWPWGGRRRVRSSRDRRRS